MHALDLCVKVERMRYPNGSLKGNLIEGISLHVPAGAFVAFLGPSGVGKTTFLRIIAGLETRYSGMVSLGSNRVCRPSREIQLVFQDYRLMPWKTVRQNIEFAAAAGSTGLDGARLATWLQLTGLADKGDAFPKTLSGGEAGRVAFARALLDPPKVLLLDEPFRNLDFVAKFALQDEFVSEVQASRPTVIFVSHSLEDALFLSDTIYVLSGPPMRIDRAYSVDVPRPRRRSDPKLMELLSLLTEELGGGNAGIEPPCCQMPPVPQ